jgi:hypothetical protein
MRFLRGLTGRVLPCGCLVGVYETYEGRVVATIDARGPACFEPEHRLHAVVPLADHQDLPADRTGPDGPPGRRA